ncbi:MAG TPA: DNA polymerase II large subunit, partial [Candidatus Thermoplasmatota archaeon]|nr:DNA polymerase II large subunit [Candidatus Thermoplasmatota archaeon]
LVPAAGSAAPTPAVSASPSTVAGPAASPAMRAYFERLHEEAMRAYAVARAARARGKDPSLDVEIPPAEDLAARVEAQVGPPGIAARIRAATVKLGNREVVSLHVARELATEMAAAGASREKVLDQAVRTGLSILTEGVLVAPLEGIAEVRIGHNMDGTDYVDMYFAGPIRAAGGTAQAMSVLLGDLVRRQLGIGRYAPTDAEVERYKEEVPAYKQAANLQYTPNAKEVELIVRNCPVCLNGEGTGDEEVTGNRDLPRVETNQLRGGACLVLAEGLVLKAPKVLKHVEALGLEGWGFLKEFLKKGEKGDAAALGADGIPEIAPNTKFTQEIIAGRPVFGHASRPGGFRLRYGRARTGGLAATAVHPATMVAVDDFLAVGTQMKVERPGKGTVATPCDEVEGPAVLLRSGSLVRIHTVEEARALRPAVQEIVDLGEMLIPFGEFAENNAHLPRSPWCLEWWQAEMEAAGQGAQAAAATGRSGEAMVALAETTGVPLHPDATLLWHDLTLLDIRELGEWVKAKGAWQGGTLSLPVEAGPKDLLVRLLALHAVEGGDLRIEPRLALPLLRCLGLDAVEGRVVDTPRRRILYDPCQPDLPVRYPTVELVSRLAGFQVRPKAPFRIGARMGRPEKADARRMAPPPHGLFPLGQAGGVQRLVFDAAEQGTVEVELGERQCKACGRRHWRTFCDCGGTTVPLRRGGHPGERPTTALDVRGEVERARKALALDRMPEAVKGVLGVINRDKVPEPLEKALLRARHDVSVFKDGTVRFDMTDVPLTHFRPREVGTPVARLRELGYTHDVQGRPLEGDGQILELRVQDIIVAESCGDYLLRASRFLDDLLTRFYGLPAFYGCEKRRDLVGHLAIGLAPHTSGGVLCRIIGYTKAQVHFAHPVYHAAKRRNCDGDEDAVLLLLDGLVNFSRAYVPDKRGGLMDLPLLLSTRLDPNEVDKEAHNVDTLSRYPLEFYRATMRHPPAKEVAKTMGLVEARIGTPAQYEGYGFTHDTRDISAGPAESAYKTLGSMMEKMTAQMELARKIRAVDEMDVGAKVIGTHLLPDLMGNLKAFSKQKVRCPKCNRKFRRMPLKGVCLGCGNENLTLTVHEGSVRKYLEVSKEIAVRYKIDAYTHQRILLLEQAVESLFQNDKVRKSKLTDFL